MKFVEAVEALKAGKKLRRSHWADNYWIRAAFGGMMLWDMNKELTTLDAEDIFSDDWDIVTKFDYNFTWMVNAKCLVYFWDDDEYAGTYGVLAKYNVGDEHLFLDVSGKTWKHCRPADRDELTFYGH